MKVSAIVVAGLLSFPFSNASAQSVNDAQIASIVVTANQVDIDAGELAKSRSTNKEVKAFAELLIPGATNDELKALLTKVRPAFVAHLEHAKHLQSSTGKDN